MAFYAVTDVSAFAGRFLSLITEAAVTAATGAFTGAVTVGSAAVGTGGSTIAYLSRGVVSIGADATSGTVALTGCLTTDRVLAQFNSGNTGAVTIETAAVSVNGTVTVTLSDVPGATTTVAVVVIR